MNTSAASACSWPCLRQILAPSKSFCSAQLDQLGSSVSPHIKEANKYICGQIKLCSLGRVCLPSLESNSGLPCTAFIYAQHERCHEPQLARCRGAAGAGCCAGTGEPEPSWQRDRQGTALPSTVQASGKWEQSRSSDSDQMRMQVPQR